MAAGTRGDMEFGVIKTVQLAQLLQAASLRLRQSLKTAKSLLVLLLWLPRAASVFSEGLRQRLRVALPRPQLSLSPMEPRLLLLRLQLQQAVSALLLALLRSLQQVLQRLLAKSSPTRRRALRPLLRLRAGVESFKAQALLHLRSLPSPLQARSNGGRSQGPVIPGRPKLLHQRRFRMNPVQVAAGRTKAPHRHHLQNNRRLVRPGSKQREG